MAKKLQPILGVHPVVSFLVVFSASLVGAMILYGAFRSTGVFESKGVQLGGAAAGFVVIFIFANRAFRSLQKQRLDNARITELTEQADRIRELESEVRRLQALDVPDIECPSGFEVYISRDFGLGFARPANFVPHPEQTVGIFMQPLNDETQAAGFRGNIAVTVTPLDKIEGLQLPENIEEVPSDALKAPFRHAIKFFSGENVEWNPTYIANRKAMGVKFNYRNRDNPRTTIAVEGAVVLDDVTQRLFIFALHEEEQRAHHSKQIFRKMLSTVKFIA